MGKVLSFVQDGLANILSGRGTTVDRGVHNFWVRRFTSPQQIEAAYLGSWLTRKIIDVPAQDMTRAGRDWDAKDAPIEKIEAEEKRLGYWSKLRDAVRLGRLGGGAILIGLGDDPSTPLPANIRPGQLQYLVVLSRWQITLGEIDTDPASPGFNQPSFFMLSGAGSQVRIHPSRMVCFHGLPIPAMHSTTPEDRFWGMSVVEAVDEAVQHATTATAGFASLIDEAKIDVYRFAGLADTLAQSGGDDVIMKRVQLTNQGKSTHRAVVLDGDDEWDQRQLALAGVRDVIITYDARVAGAADIPATRLFGKSPDGMNATGDSDLANYDQSIQAKQEMDLRPAIERLDAVMLPSAGVDPKLTWNFSPLRVLTEQQLADIENKEADTLTKLVNTGMFSEVALEESFSNRMVESQRWPGYGEKRDEQKASGEFDPSDEPEDLGIVPIPNGEKGGDPTSAGAGGAPVPPRRAANDAWMLEDWEAKTLYVRRDVLNRADIVKWAREQGFTDIVPDLHVTITYSTTPVDWMKMGESWRGKLEVEAGGPRLVEALGPDGKYKALLFTAYELVSRNTEMREKGASFDWPEYQPHISIQIGGDIDLATVQPYTGKIVLGPEIFEEIRA